MVAISSFQRKMLAEIQNYVNDHQGNPNFNGHILTLQYLQNQKASSVKPVPIGQILTFLTQKGFPLEYEQFQQGILVDLKRAGLVASKRKRGGGIYIIDNPDDIKIAVVDVLDHIYNILSNAVPITKNDPGLAHITSGLNCLLSLVDWFKTQFSK